MSALLFLLLVSLSGSLRLQIGTQYGPRLSRVHFVAPAKIAVGDAAMNVMRAGIARWHSQPLVKTGKPPYSSTTSTSSTRPSVLWNSLYLTGSSSSGETYQIRVDQVLRQTTS